MMLGRTKAASADSHIIKFTFLIGTVGDLTQARDQTGHVQRAMQLLPGAVSPTTACFLRRSSRFDRAVEGLAEAVRKCPHISLCSAGCFVGIGEVEIEMPIRIQRKASLDPRRMAGLVHTMTYFIEQKI